MADLAALTHDRFAACVDQPFHVDPGHREPMELALVEVVTRGGFDPQKDRRQPFSVVFRGPNEPVLPQRIYTLQNETLGSLDLFLVPIGPDDEGMRYEAVFT
jgi:hypothetical protein